MRIEATERATAFLTERGGMLYVWLSVRASCTGPIRSLETSLRGPGSPQNFVPVPANGFTLCFDSNGRAWPNHLDIDIRGKRRPRPTAYWNGCVYAD
jgi:hypothetical protein